MRNLLLLAPLIFAALLSCTEKSEQSTIPVSSEIANVDLLDFVGSAKGGASGEDLSAFFTNSSEVTAEDADDGAVHTEKEIQDKSFDGPLVSHESTDFIATQSNYSLVAGKLPPKEFSNSKDEAIKSVSKLNQELLAEIHRLKNASASQLNSLSTNAKSSEDELQSIKAKLIKKTDEINDLKAKNFKLEERILRLESNPMKFSLNEPIENRIKSVTPISTDDIEQQPKNPDMKLSCSLDFDAVVTLQSGKNREALYTEFFLIDDSLFDLLSGELDISVFSGISSYDELWAKSRNNPYKFPSIYKRIRNLLLSKVSSNLGHRTRTDLNGFGQFEDVQPGLYFLIGTASLGTIGVTWNVPVYLRIGSNKTSLTLSNASWRE